MLKRIVRICGSVGLVAGVLASAGLLVSAQQGGQPTGEGPRPIRLEAATFVPAAGERPPVPPGLTIAGYAPGQRGYYLVQFRGPVRDAWKDAVSATGAELLDYVPEFAFKVRMNPEQAAQVAGLESVVWVGLFHPAYKLGPDLIRDGTRVYAVRIERGADPDATAAAVDAAGAVILQRDNRRLIVSADEAALEAIARVLDVADVENFVLPVRHNEFGGGVISGANLAHANGFTGAGQTIGVADTGLGDGTPSGAHADLPAGRIAGIFDWPGAADACFQTVVNDGPVDVDSGHGTHTSLTALGSGGPGGEGRGTAPGAGLVFQAIEDYAEPSALCQVLYGLVSGYYLVGLPLDLGDLFQQAYDAGARIHSDSWGASVAGSYTTDSLNTDAFVWNHPDMTVTFSAGNAGVDADLDGLVDAGSIGAPATAKNVISVGASENDRQTHWECDVNLTYSTCAGQAGQNVIFTYGSAWPASFPAGPLHTDASAGDAEQMAAFSSRGPTLDGRIKPDLVAPGSWVLSGYSDLFQQGYDGAVNPRNGLFQYDGWGYPLNQYYKYMGGTSMANPMVAGGAAVVRDFYQQTAGHAASAALVKATLINSAVDLLDENNDGVDDNFYPIPNSAEGWGRMNLAGATDGLRQFEDEAAGLSTGGSASYTFPVAASGSPFKATLVWTDVPSTTSASKNLVNDLDLLVTAPDGVTTYRGNRFAGGWSQPGGSADRTNNVENVYVASAGAGVWTVEVLGFNVPTGPQPFALVVAGDLGTAPPPPDPPAEPTNLAAAVASYARIDLTWSDNAVDETGYQIERCEGAGCGDFALIAQLGADSTAYSDQGLAASTPYSYRVRAVNGGGASAYAGPVTATTDPAPPPPIAPGNLVAAAAGLRVDLSWTDNSSDEDEFLVERCEGAGCAAFVEIAQLPADTVAYADSSVSADVTYVYRVRASNAGGFSAYSNEASATPGPPPAPANLAATAGDRSVGLSWDGSAGATSYTVKRGLSSGGPYGVVVNLPGTSYTDTGLVNGTPYYYVVTASNGLGESQPSAEATATPAAPVPAAPANLAATAGDRQVSLTWDASAGASSYTVLRSLTSGGSYVSTATGLTATGYVDTGLVNGTTYYYVVRAVNAAGASDPSNEASATPNLTVPDPPANLVATAGAQQITLTWDLSAGATGYRIYRAQTSGGSYGTVTTTSGTSYIDTNLPDGWTFYYVVTALNGTAESAYSNEASATVGATPPDAPTNLVAQAGDGRVDLSWAPGSGAASYTVKRSTTSGGPYSDVAAGVGSTSYADTGVVNGTQYFYVVTAVNASGESGPSNEASATPTPALPDPPANLTAVAGDRQVSLSWGASAGAASYTVLRSLTSGSNYVSTATGLTDTAYVDTGLVNGTTYYYLVRAVNAAGASDPSNEASATPDLPVPDPPTNLVATAGDQQVSLAWDPSAGATGYRIRRSLTSGTDYGIVTTTTATAYVDANLPNGTTFYYVVTALNGTAESAYSNEASATPGPSVPDAPTGLTVTVPSHGRKKLELSWNGSSGATSYRVKRAIVSGGPYTIEATGVTTTTYTDTGLANGTTYYYVVSAVGPGGEGPDSGEAGATTVGRNGSGASARGNRSGKTAVRR